MKKTDQSRQGMDQLKTDFPEADVVLVRDRAELMRSCLRRRCW